MVGKFLGFDFIIDFENWVYFRTMVFVLGGGRTRWIYFQSWSRNKWKSEFYKSPPSSTSQFCGIKILVNISKKNSKINQIYTQKPPNNSKNSPIFLISTKLSRLSKKKKHSRGIRIMVFVCVVSSLLHTLLCTLPIKPTLSFINLFHPSQPTLVKKRGVGGEIDTHP